MIYLLLFDYPNVKCHYWSLNTSISVFFIILTLHKLKTQCPNYYYIKYVTLNLNFSKNLRIIIILILNKACTTVFPKLCLKNNF